MVLLGMGIDILGTRIVILGMEIIMIIILGMGIVILGMRIVILGAGTIIIGRRILIPSGAGSVNPACMERNLEKLSPFLFHLYNNRGPDNPSKMPQHAFLHDRFF